MQAREMPRHQEAHGLRLLGIRLNLPPFSWPSFRLHSAGPRFRISSQALGHTPCHPGSA